MPVSLATRKALHRNLNAMRAVIALASLEIGVACYAACAAHAMAKKLRLESMRGTFQCIA